MTIYHEFTLDQNVSFATILLDGDTRATLQ